MKRLILTALMSCMLIGQVKADDSRISTGVANSLFGGAASAAVTSILSHKFPQKMSLMKMSPAMALAKFAVIFLGGSASALSAVNEGRNNEALGGLTTAVTTTGIYAAATYLTAIIKTILKVYR